MPHTHDHNYKQNTNISAAHTSRGGGAFLAMRRPRVRLILVSMCVAGLLALCVGVGVSLLVNPDAAADFGRTPRVLVWAAFMGRTFALHAALAAILLAVVGAILAKRRRWFFVLPVITLVWMAWPEARLCFPRARASASTHTLPASRGEKQRVQSDAAVARETLRVLSVNLLFMNNDVSRVLEQIRAADADILMLQEYHQDWDLDLYPALRETYPFECRPLREGIFGQAVYSRVPIVGEPKLLRLHLDDYCPQVGIVVNVGGREVEVWDVHLISPSNPEYIMRQCEQMRVLRGEIEKRERPQVFVGDFNSTAMSWTANTMRSLSLREAHATVGSGRGATWPVVPLLRYAPGVRIDQAWGTPEIEWKSSRVMGETGSDHLPIRVEFGVQRQ